MLPADSEHSAIFQCLQGTPFIDTARLSTGVPTPGLRNIQLTASGGAFRDWSTDDLKKAVIDAKSGQIELRNDKDGNIGASIGKKSFSDEQLIKNYNAILETLEKEKSNVTVKGDLIKNTFITSTMGVSYKLKLSKNI